MKKFAFVLLFLTSFVRSQDIRFVIIDQLNVRSASEVDHLAKLTNSLNQLNDLDFVVFNGLSLDLDNPDELIPKSIRKIYHPVYVLPSSSDFWLARSAREKFMNLFGDLNFRKNFKSLKVIGLNSEVAWSSDPSFERETFNFVDDTKLDSLSTSVLILNSDPEEIKNFDHISEHFNGSKVKFIIAPLNSKKEFERDAISKFNSNVNSRKNEFYKLFELRNDTLEVRTSDVEGNLSKTNHYTFKENRFSALKSSVTYDKDKLLKWNYDLGYSVSGKVLVYENKIFVADVSGQVVCLDTLGRKIWEYFSFGYIYSEPTAKDGYLAIATVQGDLETLNARTGKAIQSLGFNSSITSDLLSFEYPGSYNNLMIPKESRSKAAVIAGTENGKLYCYDLETLQELWKFEKPKDAIIGKPIYNKNQVLFYSLDGTLYSVNAQTGLLAWSSKLTRKNESSVYASNIVSNDDDVFISLTNGKIFSFDILLGKKNWEVDKYKLSTSLNISSNGKLIYARSTNDRLHVLSAQQGTWIREIITKVGNNSSNTDITELGRNIYFGTDDGYLVEIDDDYKYNKIFRNDNTPLFSITPVGKNKLVLGYHTGMISLLRIK